ncbi:hypothetical protein OAX78_00965 [Planctomycetota bacterium]|nr:hypothetical protein [Planctomycetota bacterium]
MSDDETRKGYKRLNHFHGLRLESEDFETGEAYHLEKRKLHNRMLHGAGVVRRWKGELKCVSRRRGDMSLDIYSGYGIDGNGNDMILWEPRIVTIDPGKMLPQLPATAHIVLKYVDDPSDFVVNKANPKFRGHRRIYETVRIDVEAKEPNLEDGVELARILITEDTIEITDARDPANPGPGEIDLRYSPQAGAGGSQMDMDLVNMLRKIFPELRGSLGSLARNGIHSARDMRAAVVTLEMLLETNTLDSPELIKGLRLMLELADEMRTDVDAHFPELNGVREWEQWKEVIESLRGMSKEAKPLRGDIENLLNRLGSASDSLRLASDVKKPEPAPMPVAVAGQPEAAEEGAEEEPEAEPEPEVPTVAPGAVEISWEDLKKSSKLPDKIYMDGKNFTLVDQIALGDRKSEAAHSFAIEGAKQDWSTNQSFKYPDGVKATARGKAHVGGLSKWTIGNLAPGRDVVIAKRIDFVRGDIITRIEIDGAAVGDWSIDGSDRKFRWRNWLFKVPGDSIKSSSAECRQVAVEAERDINMFGLWFYQAVE